MNGNRIINFTLTPIFLICFQGGEVVQETITSDVNDDLITLEFQRSDGTLITQLIDFRNVSIKSVVHATKKSNTIFFYFVGSSSI